MVEKDINIGDYYNVDRIISYLSKYKNELDKLYDWSIDVKKIDEKIITVLEKNEIENAIIPLERDILLREKVGRKLINEYGEISDNFNLLCKWIIKEWGKIRLGKEDVCIKVKKYLETYRTEADSSAVNIVFNRISSISKVLAFYNPEEFFIYDSRVVNAMNWIILSESAGKKFFPPPEGRNSKLKAFDINVLIRLKYIKNYKTESKNISEKDKEIYIEKNEAYNVLRKLIKLINPILWRGYADKEKKLAYTEMLLFALADTEIFADITRRGKQIICE